MNILKKTTALLLTFCIALCLLGCGDEYSKFSPSGVYIVDRLNSSQYEYQMDDEKFAEEMWKKYKELDIYEDSEAVLGEAYLFLRFYNKDDSTEAVFTIYENGSCCLGYDYDTLYTVENGRSVYMEFCELYESYDPDKKTT